MLFWIEISKNSYHIWSYSVLFEQGKHLCVFLIILKRCKNGEIIQKSYISTDVTN